MNNSTTKSSNVNNLIQLYPFNGRSPYLIDKFYIIGYNYYTLRKLLIVNTPKAIEEDNEKETREPHKFNIEEEPSILNEIISDYNKVGLPNETILSMIFPKKLDFYYTTEELGNILLKRSIATNLFSINPQDSCKIDFKNKKNIPKSYKVVFSSNPQSENNSKKSINGFAYIFYKKFIETKKVMEKKKKYVFYVPYTFCIISEYPYFNSFYRLCKCIKNFYNQKAIYIPIEFLIHNIVTLSPSPINSDIILDLKSSSEQDNSFGNYNKALSVSNTHLSTINETNNEMNTTFKTDIDLKNVKEINNLTKNGFVLVDDDSYLPKKYTYKKINTYSSIFNNNNNIIRLTKDNYQIIKFKILSGYPLIQYNLSKVLLSNLNPEKVITIFLYTFLEKDVIFFSKDIEYLTLTLNAYLNLNFPLNDEKYYFIGAPISFENFSYGNGEFGLKNYTSIIGINDQFRPDYKNKNLKIQDHLVIDLDKGDIHQGLDENNNNVNENNKKIIRLIKRICDGNEDEKTKKKIFYQAIKNLSDRLKKIYESMVDNGKKNINFIVSKYLDFDDGEEMDNNSNNNNYNNNNNALRKTMTQSFNYFCISKKNREIQEAFYEFVHNVCLYFYENLSIKAPEDQQQNKTNNNISKKDLEAGMNVIFNKQYNSKESENQYTEEEKIFLDELTDTMKFQSFVFGFLQSYNPIDLYKIPLTFTEEFLSIISRKKEQITNEKKIDYFELIDSLYMGEKQNTGKKKKIEQKTINFDIINFNYFKKYKTFFDREIYDKSKTKYFSDNRQLIKFISGKSIKINEIIKQRILIYQTYELDDNLLLRYIHLTKNLAKQEYMGTFYGSFFVEENIFRNFNINEIETKIETYSIEKELLSDSDVCCANIILLFTLSLKSLRESIDCQTFLGILFQDFTVFRKYYSILLRMIYKLYLQQKNFASTLCYYPCINSIRIKKLVPNEDLMKIIHQIDKINIGDLLIQISQKKDEIKVKDEKIKNVKLYGEDLPEIPITTDNLYVFNNFTREGFVSEEEIIACINKNNYQIDVKIKNGEIITPQIRFNNGIHKHQGLFYSQRILLDNLYKQFIEYIEDLDDNKLKVNTILDSCLNVFIFMRNHDEFRGKDDLFEILKCIFYIFMNQLYILKSIKENE